MLGVRVRAAVAAVAIVTVAPSVPHSQSRADDRRAALEVLEAMIATGRPAETAHDEGEWLQRVVDDLIARGDREVERLAVRAAAPLRAAIANPVIRAGSSPNVMITAANVLRVPKPIPYTATLYASLDGSDLVEFWTQRSGAGAGFGLTTLGVAAMKPGGHHLRVRAQLVFGDPRKPSWTEIRDLPELVYAVYDPATAGAARDLVHGPIGFTAADFDAALPRQRLELWLAEILAPHSRPDRFELNWESHYCDMRTADPRGLVDDGAVCAVLYFEAGSRIGQLWFRTADVELQPDRVAWMPLAVPRFEGIILGERNADALSALPRLLQTTPAEERGGDVAILPAEIAVAPSPAGGTDVSITVRNQGEDHLFNVYVQVMFGSDPRAAASSRHFVVSVPPSGMTDVRTRVAFGARYGWIIAHAFQVTEHSPIPGTTQDPTPENACGIRVLNPEAAPPEVIADFRRTSASQCQVQFR